MTARAQAARPGIGARGRAVFALGVLAFSASIVLRSIFATTAGGGDPWRAGEWLINYSAGFIRRGLFGELLLRLAPHGEAVWVLLAAQLLCYALSYGYLIGAMAKRHFDWTSIALVCGPAALPFVGWDPPGAFRKEILVFASWACCAWARGARSPARHLSWALAGLLGYAVATFSWEGSVFALPVVLYLLVGGAPTADATRRRRAVAVAAVAVGVAAVGAVSALFSHGDVTTASTICARVRDAGLGGPTLCSGAIDAVGWSLERNVRDVRDALPADTGYVLLIALAWLPALTTSWFRRNRWWVLAIGVGVLPLYVIAYDWGRWTHLTAIGLAVGVLSSASAQERTRVWTPLSTVLYVSLWGIPHFVGINGQFSAMGLLVQLSTYAQHAVGRILG